LLIVDFGSDVISSLGGAKDLPHVSHPERSEDLLFLNVSGS